MELIYINDKGHTKVVSDINGSFLVPENHFALNVLNENKLYFCDDFTALEKWHALNRSNDTDFYRRLRFAQNSNRLINGSTLFPAFNEIIVQSEEPGEPTLMNFTADSEYYTGLSLSFKHDGENALPVIGDTVYNEDGVTPAVIGRDSQMYTIDNLYIVTDENGIVILRSPVLGVMPVMVYQGDSGFSQQCYATSQTQYPVNGDRLYLDLDGTLATNLQQAPLEFIEQAFYYFDETTSKVYISTEEDGYISLYVPE